MIKLILPKVELGSSECEMSFFNDFLMYAPLGDSQWGWVGKLTLK